MIKIKFDKCGRIFQSDNGTKFCNALSKGLFDSLGIIHQTSCGCTPKQSGIAKRNHIYLLDVT